MAFVVKYLQDIPQNCSECPCSVHITKDEVYCNARQKHFVVSDKRPEECSMMECNEIINPDEIEEKICKTCKWHGDMKMNALTVTCALSVSGFPFKDIYYTCKNWEAMKE